MQLLSFLLIESLRALASGSCSPVAKHLGGFRVCLRFESALLELLFFKLMLDLSFSLIVLVDPLAIALCEAFSLVVNLVCRGLAESLSII